MVTNANIRARRSTLASLGSLEEEGSEEEDEAQSESNIAMDA